MVGQNVSGASSKLVGAQKRKPLNIIKIIRSKTRNHEPHYDYDYDPQSNQDDEPYYSYAGLTLPSEKPNNNKIQSIVSELKSAKQSNQHQHYYSPRQPDQRIFFSPPRPAHCGGITISPLHIQQNQTPPPAHYHDNSNENDQLRLHLNIPPWYSPPQLPRKSINVREEKPLNLNILAVGLRMDQYGTSKPPIDVRAAQVATSSRKHYEYNAPFPHHHKPLQQPKFQQPSPLISSSSFVARSPPPAPNKPLQQPKFQQPSPLISSSSFVARSPPSGPNKPLQQPKFQQPSPLISSSSFVARSPPPLISSSSSVARSPPPAPNKQQQRGVRKYQKRVSKRKEGKKNNGSKAKKVVHPGGVKPKQRRYRTERPFYCPHCATRFTLRSNMERHGKHQHASVWQRSPSIRVLKKLLAQQLQQQRAASAIDSSATSSTNVRMVLGDQLKKKKMSNNNEDLASVEMQLETNGNEGFSRNLRSGPAGGGKPARVSGWREGWGDAERADRRV